MPETNVNQTIRRFGHPETLVAEYAHWVVLLRTDQPTLGSLVLAARSQGEAFSALPAPAFAELARVTGDIEKALRKAVSYEKINYLMLMMADPNVHFHVIPRYQGLREAEGIVIADSGWPKTPALGDVRTLDQGEIVNLVRWLKACWD